MRTNIYIDDRLMSDALALTGLRTKRAAVEHALQELIRKYQRLAVLELRGIGWEGDLDAMRTDIDA